MQDNANIMPADKPSKDDAKGRRLVTKHQDKGAVLKRALKYHLAGLNGGRSGLVFKGLERLSKLVDSPDDATALQAIDKIVKLLPYAITREENPGLLNLQGQAGPVNIQINFDQQIKERLQGTHLQGLINSLVPSSEQAGISEDAEDAQFSTPPPTPGDAPHVS